MSTRWSKPPGGKRKAPRRKQNLSGVKQAALGETAARILQPEADKRENSEEVEKEKRKTFIQCVNLYINSWAKEPHFHMPAHLESWWRLWWVASGLVRRKQTFYQKTKAPQTQRWERDTQRPETERGEILSIQEWLKLLLDQLHWDSQFIVVT